jgi:hypothetical protein
LSKRFLPGQDDPPGLLQRLGGALASLGTAAAVRRSCFALALLAAAALVIAFPIRPVWSSLADAWQGWRRRPARGSAARATAAAASEVAMPAQRQWPALDVRTWQAWPSPSMARA